MATTQRSSLILLIWLTCLCLHVNCKPLDDSDFQKIADGITSVIKGEKEIFPGVSTNIDSWGKVKDMATGDRDFNFSLSKNGIKATAGFSRDEKLLIAGGCLLGLSVLCCLCCKCCGRSTRSTPSTTIVYQQMPNSRPQPAVSLSTMPSVPTNWKIHAPVHQNSIYPDLSVKI